MSKQKNKLAGLQKRKAISGYLFISPFIIGFLVFMVKPLFESCYMSFCEVNLAAGQVTKTLNGITNYIFAFRVDPEYNRLLWEEVTRMMCALREGATFISALIFLIDLMADISVDIIFSSSG